MTQPQLSLLHLEFSLSAWPNTHNIFKKFDAIVSIGCGVKILSILVIQIWKDTIQLDRDHAFSN